MKGLKTVSHKESYLFKLSGSSDIRLGCRCIAYNVEALAMLGIFKN